jgi:hypothetical protein
MKYDVHIYAVVRVKIEAVEADSQVAAIQEAQKGLDLEEAVRSGEYAEEITGFLVDEVGDENYSQSRAYQADGVTLEKPAKDSN